MAFFNYEVCAMTLSDDDNSLRDNIIVNGTTTRYRYVELLNGWYGQAYMQTSGGYDPRAMDAGKKIGDSFTPPYNMTIARVLLYVDGDNTPTTDQMWKISLQSTNPATGMPSGTELASVTESAVKEGIPCSGDCGAIQQWNFTTPANVTRGVKYWIVTEYVSGPAPSGSQTIYPIRNVVFTPEEMTPEYNYIISTWNKTNSIPINNIWGLQEYTWRDPTFRRCTYSGGLWSASSCNQKYNYGTIAVETVNGDVYGSVHRHKFTSVLAGTDVQAQQFRVFEQDVTVNQIVIAVGNEWTPTTPPNVNLSVEIWEGNASVNTPASHTTLRSIPNFIDRLQYARNIPAIVPFTQYIDPPLTLEKGKTYMVVAMAPGITSTYAYTMDMAGPRDSDYHAEDPWYGGRLTYERTADGRNYASAYMASTAWTPQSSSSRYKYDLPVPMKLTDRYDGEFTTLSLDKGTGNAWANVSFNFEIQTGTSIKAEYRISDDNVTWGGWTYLNSANTLSPGTVYELPVEDQKRYIQLKGWLYTTNPAHTPILHSITLDSSTPYSPPQTTPPSIMSFSPASANPSQDEGTTNIFSMSVNQPVTSRWILDSIQQSSTTTSYTKTWSFADAGIHIVTYIGDNANGSVSNTWTITVNNVADITPPIITGLGANPTTSGAAITWITDENSTSTVYYGSDTSYSTGILSSPAMVLSHIAVISGLSNGTPYHYKVSSTDADGNTANSTDNNFTTTSSSSGLVGWWSFDDGTATDSSGNNNHGTIYGAIAAPGKSGGALQFDGVDDYVQVADSDTLEGMPQLTVEAWVYYQGGEGYARIIDKWKTGGGIYQLYKYSTTDNIGGYLAGILSGNVNTNVAYTKNAWQKIAMTYNGSAAVWYKDGLPVYARSGLTGAIGTSTDPLYIGGASNFNGTIDEVKIYSRALSAAEILSEYNAGSATVPSAPVLSAAAGNANVSLTWTTPVDGGSAITNYQIYRNDIFTGTSAITMYKDAGLTNGVSYSYEVSAINAIGEGPKSNQASATPATPLQLHINVKTLKDVYSIGELVNIMQ